MTVKLQLMINTRTFISHDGNASDHGAQVNELLISSVTVKHFLITAYG